MVIDPELLQAARSALDDIAAAEQNLIDTRGALATAVHNLHAGGGSLREIADVLGLSHQRIHQLVAGARREPGITCSFCGAEQRERERLIAGPEAVAICNRCVDPASTLIEQWATDPDSPRRRIDPALRVEAAQARCSFCRKKVPGQVPVIAASLGGVGICGECLALCFEILAEVAGQDA